jgi:hypothetical protein
MELFDEGLRVLFITGLMFGPIMMANRTNGWSMFVYVALGLWSLVAR